MTSPSIHSFLAGWGKRWFLIVAFNSSTSIVYTANTRISSANTAHVCRFIKMLSLTLVLFYTCILLCVQLADIAVDSFCRGIFAGDCRKLSMRSCFPAVYNVEQRRRSLILGTLLDSGTLLYQPSCQKVDKYVCIYVYMHIYTCIYIYIRIYMYILYVCVYIYICIFIFVYQFMYVYCICIYICKCVHVHVCICLLYIHICTPTQKYDALHI